MAHSAKHTGRVTIEGGIQDRKTPFFTSREFFSTRLGVEWDHRPVEGRKLYVRGDSGDES
jgi:hypothetical protein